MRTKAILIAVWCVLFAALAVAQDTTKDTDMAQKKDAADYSKDHVSIDSIIKATYDVISGGKDEKRDWERFRALFYTGARLIPSGNNREGKFGASSRTPDEYIKTSEPFLMGNGFYEKEIARKTDTFGNIAHVFSTYEGKNSLTDTKPLVRGINSFQLVNDGKRWWVLTIFWQAESPDTPLPDKYLKNGF